jgi:hypothetical protein
MSSRGSVGVPAAINRFVSTWAFGLVTRDATKERMWTASVGDDTDADDATSFMMERFFVVS